MDYIKKIKEVKTFEELLILRDDLDDQISDYKGDIMSNDYHEHGKCCKYRNMIECRINFLIKNGAKIDQIELKT